MRPSSLHKPYVSTASLQEARGRCSASRGTRVAGYPAASTTMATARLVCLAIGLLLACFPPAQTAPGTLPHIPLPSPSSTHKPPSPRHPAPKPPLPQPRPPPPTRKPPPLPPPSRQRRPPGSGGVGGRSDPWAGTYCAGFLDWQFSHYPSDLCCASCCPRGPGSSCVPYCLWYKRVIACDAVGGQCQGDLSQDSHGCTECQINGQRVPTICDAACLRR